MQKQRINLKEKYPNYFATVGDVAEFQELDANAVARLEKLEAALTPKADASTGSATSASTSSADEAPKGEGSKADASTRSATGDQKQEAPKASEEDSDLKKIKARLDNLEKENGELKAELAKKPAAASTEVSDDRGGEGGGEQAKNYATSVDAELAKYGVKSNQ